MIYPDVIPRETAFIVGWKANCQKWRRNGRCSEEDAGAHGRRAEGHPDVVIIGCLFFPMGSGG